jgi:leucyl aminopeptidase (aminopeptidase T)
MLNPLEFIRGVRLITDVCLEVGPGESVLCIADRQENMEILTLIAAECEARGAEVAVTLIGPRKHHHHEPPRTVAHAMQKADIVIVMTFGSLVHTQARKQANAAGVKIALMGEVTREFLSSFDLTKEELLKVRTQTEEIVRRLTAARSARMTTKAGTDLTMSLEGRNGVGLVPFGEKGTFFGVPGYAEAACPPVEDSAEGVLFVDGTMMGTEDMEALVQEPFEMRFEKGRLVSISGGRDGRRVENLLNGLEDQARVFAELGVNSNFMVPKKLRGSRLDMLVGGHIHCGLGRNDHIGGKSAAATHLDFLVTYATLLLDGVPIIEEGNLKI